MKPWLRLVLLSGIQLETDEIISRGAVIAETELEASFKFQQRIPNTSAKIPKNDQIWRGLQGHLSGGLTSPTNSPMSPRKTYTLRYKKLRNFRSLQTATATGSGGLSTHRGLRGDGNGGRWRRQRYEGVRVSANAAFELRRRDVSTGRKRE